MYMSVLNIVILVTSYFTYFKPITIPNINIKMIDDNNIFNTDGISGLKLFKAQDTKDFTIRWLYKTLEEPTLSPSFVINDLVNMLTYSVKEPDKYDLFIAYMPDRFEDEPQFIAYVSIKPNLKLLSIEQICTNPFNKDCSLTDYKKKLLILATNSNVKLSVQPLKYITNPRYYLEFTQSF